VTHGSKKINISERVKNLFGRKGITNCGWKRTWLFTMPKILNT